MKWEYNEAFNGLISHKKVYFFLSRIMQIKLSVRKIQQYKNSRLDGLSVSIVDRWLKIIKNHCQSYSSQSCCLNWNQNYSNLNFCDVSFCFFVSCFSDFSSFWACCKRVFCLQTFLRCLYSVCAVRVLSICQWILCLVVSVLVYCDSSTDSALSPRTFCLPQPEGL